jgi:hypothetical protein
MATPKNAPLSLLPLNGVAVLPSHQTAMAAGFTPSPVLHAILTSDSVIGCRSAARSAMSGASIQPWPGEVLSRSSRGRASAGSPRRQPPWRAARAGSRHRDRQSVLSMHRITDERAERDRSAAGVATELRSSPEVPPEYGHLNWGTGREAVAAPSPSHWPPMRRLAPGP